MQTFGLLFRICLSFHLSALAYPSVNTLGHCQYHLNWTWVICMKSVCVLSGVFISWSGGSASNQRFESHSKLSCCVLGQNSPPTLPGMNVNECLVFGGWRGRWHKLAATFLSVCPRAAEATDIAYQHQYVTVECMNNGSSVNCLSVQKSAV